MLKKSLALALCLVLLLGLTACGSQERYMHLYNYIVENGEKQDGEVYSISNTTSDGNALLYFMANASQEGAMSLYCYTLGSGESSLMTHDVLISLTCGEKTAAFLAEDYTEVDYDGRPATITTVSSGSLDLKKFNSSTKLTPTSYESTTVIGTINYTDTDIANADTAQLQEFIGDTLGYAEEYLAELGLGVSLKDLGFTAWR